MTCTILLHDAMRAKAGKERIVLTFEGAQSIDEVIKRMAIRFPDLREFKRNLRFQLNGTPVGGDQIVRQDDEIALSPLDTSAP